MKSSKSALQRCSTKKSTIAAQVYCGQIRKKLRYLRSLDLRALEDRIFLVDSPFKELPYKSFDFKVNNLKSIEREIRL